jgi:hypothetical protein
MLVATCLATQLAWTRGRRLPAFDARSALISGLSLCLLCRANDPLLRVAAAIVAISSKFLVRIRGKHVFNPTNIGLAVMLLVSDAVWVSPGQWGNPAWFAFLMAGLGFLVVTRAARADVTLAFLFFYAALVAGRSYWLGEPAAIPIHRLQSGALLLFAFFMISDPKTTPDSRAGRLLFAALVAAGAWYVQFRLFRTNGLLWSLACGSLLVPLIDRLLPGSRYAWSAFAPCGASARQAAFLAPRLGAVGFANLQSSTHNQLRLPMRRFILFVGLASCLLGFVEPLRAFCGFYVAKADTSLFNRASQVVLARDGDRTVLTMASDFKGEPKEFAVVIPVPTFITREQNPRRRQGADRSHRCLHRAAAGRVLRQRSLPSYYEMLQPMAEEQPGIRWRRRKRARRRSASPSRRSTPSASTTS